MKKMLMLAMLFSLSLNAEEAAKTPVKKTDKDEVAKASTIVVAVEQGKSTSAPKGDDNVTLVSGGVEKKYILNGSPIILGARANILTNQGYSKDYIGIDAEGYLRYGLAKVGPGDNFRIISDLGYAMGYDKYIGFKGTMGIGLTLALCSNQKEGEIKDWRVCWLNSAKGQIMFEKAVWLEASSAIEVQKKINESLRIRGGARVLASTIHDTEANKDQSSTAVVGTIGVDWDFIPTKKAQQK